MRVLRKIYNVINNSIQSRIVNSKEEANKYIISLNRTLENKVSLETVDNKQIEAIKIDGKWCISETEIIEQSNSVKFIHIVGNQQTISCTWSCSSVYRARFF